MKMYILLKNDIPNKFAPVIAAHASLACYKKFENNENMKAWINGVFKKVVCLVNENEFSSFKNDKDYVLLTESALDNKEVCLAFCPRKEFPKKFNFLKLWTPQNIS